MENLATDRIGRGSTEASQVMIRPGWQSMDQMATALGKKLLVELWWVWDLSISCGHRPWDMCIAEWVQRIFRLQKSECLMSCCATEIAGYNLLFAKPCLQSLVCKVFAVVPSIQITRQPCAERPLATMTLQLTCNLPTNIISSCSTPRHWRFPNIIGGGFAGDQETQQLVNQAG